MRVCTPGEHFSKYDICLWMGPEVGGEGMTSFPVKLLLAYLWEEWIVDGPSRGRYDPWCIWNICHHRCVRHFHIFFSCASILHPQLSSPGSPYRVATSSRLMTCWGWGVRHCATVRVLLKTFAFQQSQWDGLKAESRSLRRFFPSPDRCFFWLEVRRDVTWELMMPEEFFWKRKEKHVANDLAFHIICIRAKPQTCNCSLKSDLPGDAASPLSILMST